MALPDTLGPSEVVAATGVTLDLRALTRDASAGLAPLADASAATAMAAYMKTDMPFYGVKKPQRRPVLKTLVDRHPPSTRTAYESAVAALWTLPHREEKYLAIGYARAFPAHVVAESLPLYRRMIVEGAGWDFVDEIASHLVGAVLLHDRRQVETVLDRWIVDPDMWLRRTALIAQLRHGEHTDRSRLFEYCLRCAPEPEFFIRKAIGWALRQYARTDPEAVRTFVEAHRDKFSALTVREATRHLG